MNSPGASRAEKRFRSSTDALAGEIREAILKGKLAPGEKLFEAKLMASLRVGGVVLRQALRSLEAAGYVTFVGNNQVVVSRPSWEDVQDYYTIAGALEGLAARLAVERAQPEEVAHLRELHQFLKEACERRDLAHYFEANSSFHRFIAELAHNERLYRMIEQLRGELQKTRVISLTLPQRLEYSMREHDQIMDAFLKRNAQLAESMVVRHLNNHKEALQKALEKTAP